MHIVEQNQSELLHCLVENILTYAVALILRRSKAFEHFRLTERSAGRVPADVAVGKTRDGNVVDERRRGISIGA